MKRKAPRKKGKPSKPVAKRICGWPSTGCSRAIRLHRRQGRTRPVIMISSAVYGNEVLLDQISAILTGFGWDVWMSHQGTIPVDSSLSNLDNCLEAVRACDAFLGIITGRYGSGKVKSGKSVTQLEMELAIELGVRRWWLVSGNIMFARQLLRHIKRQIPDLRERVDWAHNPLINDWGVIDMYDKAIRDGLSFEDRLGGWVHTFNTSSEAADVLINQLNQPYHLFPQYAGQEPRGGIS